MNTPSHIIIIDDDLVNNMICCFAIKKTGLEINVQTFNIPEIAFDFIKNGYDIFYKRKTIVFLDIYMPTLSGWDFLNNFDELERKVKDQFFIYIISSSVDLCDKVQAKKNRNVIDYFEKPIKSDTILNVMYDCAEMVV